MRQFEEGMNIKKCVIIGILMMTSIGLIGCSKGKVKGVSGKNSSGQNAGRAADSNVSSDKIPEFGEQEIAFSKAGYFYSMDTAVEILSKKPGKIYYTTDGSEPDKKQNLYKEAIKLIANQDTKANCFKAKAFFEDGTESKTVIHTYFVGKNVTERFDTPIFSVTTDPYNLYDYEYGIFTEGKLRDDFIKDNPNAEIDPSSPANYNMRGKESEREVYLEILTPDGTRITGQAAGIRTYGGWSRANKQKSIKIYARKEYDKENSKLCYEFFPDRTDVKGKVIDSYKQLVLRSCGNDNGFAFIRDELFQTLSGQAGYPDYEAVSPAAMFVNGEYRGFYWLHEVYGDDYFKDHYGKYSGKFEIIEGGELFKIEEEDGKNAQVIKDYEDIYSAYSKLDLTDDKNYGELCKAVDVENYLSYYALQIYIGNEDWPHNNYKTYRYYTAKGETYGMAPFDGKWRYLLHDMDFSTGIYGTGAYVDNIQRYIGSNGEIMDICPLFGQLMKRKDCREVFLKKTLDLINGAFAPGNLNSVLDKMNKERSNELSHTYDKGLLEDWVTKDLLKGKLNELKDYASERADHILTKYQEYFNLGDPYVLTVKPAKGCKVKVNTFETDKSFKGSYYSDYATEVSITKLPEGREFDYWKVNGKKIGEEKLTVTAAMVTDGAVHVSLVMK